MSNSDIWIEEKVDEEKRIETSTFTIIGQRVIESKYLHIPIKCTGLIEMIRGNLACLRFSLRPLFINGMDICGD